MKLHKENRVIFWKDFLEIQRIFGYNNKKETVKTVELYLTLTK